MILLNPTQILSHGSFLLQTPDEMGHLSSSNGCGVRSCDSLWEKRTNVSSDICLSVRAEEVSLPKDLGTLRMMFTGSGIVMTSRCKHLLSRVKIQTEPIQDPSLEAVSDLTLKHTPFPHLMPSKTVLSLLLLSARMLYSVERHLTTVCCQLFVSNLFCMLSV